MKKWFMNCREPFKLYENYSFWTYFVKKQSDTQKEFMVHVATRYISLVKKDEMFKSDTI